MSFIPHMPCPTCDRLRTERDEARRRLARINFLLTKRHEKYASPEIGMGIVIATLEQITEIAGEKP